MYLSKVPCTICKAAEYVFIVHVKATKDGKQIAICDDCAPLVLKPECVDKGL